MADDVNIKIIEGGPLRVSGVPLGRIGIERNEHGRPIAWIVRGNLEHAEAYALCRCGQSGNKPFCDGTHKRVQWDSNETADRAPSATRRRRYGGNEVAMTDDKSLCVHAGFCVREHAKAWDLARDDVTDPQRELLTKMVHACPSGRLEIHDPANGPTVEPEMTPRIDVVDDGPLYVQGGIAVESSDGRAYEVRNRMTLCRCGASANKPFCDSSHKEAGFRDV